MDGQLKPRFFKTMIWIDSNKGIKTQASHLIWMYGSFLEFYEKATDAAQLIKSKRNEELLIICSSRQVESCHKTFKIYGNVFQKFIVFCGSRTRATEIKTYSIYKDAVQDAYWEMSDLINGVSVLEQELLKKPQLFQQKVIIAENKLPPVISQEEAPAFMENLKKVSQEKQQQKKKNQEANKKKIKQQNQAKEFSNQMSKLAIEGQNSMPSTELNQPQPKESEIDIPDLPNRVKEQGKIIWAYEQNQQDVQNNYIRKLKRRGYPIGEYNTADQLKYIVQDEVDKCFFLIAWVGVNIEQIKSNCNNLATTIRVSNNKTDGEGLLQEECFADSLDEIIKKLESAGVSDS